METNQRGFTMAMTVLPGFTIVMGAWFVLTHDMAAVQSEPKSVINEMLSIFK